MLEAHAYLFISDVVHGSRSVSSPTWPNTQLGPESRLQAFRKCLSMKRWILIYNESYGRVVPGVGPG